MRSRSTRVSQATIACLGAAAVLLALGVFLLAMEPMMQEVLGADVGPWGANFVLLGTIVGAYGFWKCWPHLETRAGLKLSGFLIALGLILLILASDVEPFLVGVAAIGLLLPGLRGAIYYLASFLPRPNHGGIMSLREKAAVFSLLANGLLVVYLLSKAQAIGQTAPLPSAGATGAIAATAGVVLGVLVVESVIIAFLRRRGDTETLEDERDVEIGKEAGSVSHVVLFAAVLIVAIQLGIGGAMEPSLSPNEVLGLSSPLAIAHALVALLLLSQCSRSITEIWQYRRARR